MSALRNPTPAPSTNSWQSKSSTTPSNPITRHSALAQPSLQIQGEEDEDESESGQSSDEDSSQATRSIQRGFDKRKVGEMEVLANEILRDRQMHKRRRL